MTPAPASHTYPLWHPFADMHAVKQQQLSIVRGDDVWVWDSEGNRYFDGTASLWYSNVGHGRSEIVQAITKQLEELEAYHCFGDFANEPALRLAGQLAERAPIRGGKVFFTSGGGDSIESAAKIIRAYFDAVGQPERTVLIHRQHSYHGTHGFGTALAGMPANRFGGPYIRDVAEVPTFDAAALEETILEVGADRTAAFFCEPVIGSGGVLAPPPNYIAEAHAVCRRHGVMFVADGVICAFGRLGTWFGIERFGVEPDVITFAKGVTSGYQPLGGLIVSPRIAAPFWDEPGRVLRHGQTYAGHPAACAAGIANLDIYEREGLLERSMKMEDVLAEALQTLVDHPLVDHARAGTGFLAALELDADLLAGTPGLPAMISNAVRRHGTLIRPMISALGFSPPLTATEQQLDSVVEGVRAGLDEVNAALR